MFFNSDSPGLLVYFDTSVFDPNHGLPVAQEYIVTNFGTSSRAVVRFSLLQQAWHIRTVDKGRQAGGQDDAACCLCLLT
jgi:hypothetical protein